jgi:hypothetical protein
MKNTIVENQLKKKVWQLVLPEKSCATFVNKYPQALVSMAIGKYPQALPTR